MLCRHDERMGDLRVNNPKKRWKDDLPEERGDQVTQIATDVDDECEHAADKADKHGYLVRGRVAASPNFSPSVGLCTFLANTAVAIRAAVECRPRATVTATSSP